jgi:hypothetical protein
LDTKEETVSRLIHRSFCRIHTLGRTTLTLKLVRTLSSLSGAWLTGDLNVTFVLNFPGEARRKLFAPPSIDIKKS